MFLRSLRFTSTFLLVENLSMLLFENNDSDSSNDEPDALAISAIRILRLR